MQPRNLNPFRRRQLSCKGRSIQSIYLLWILVIATVLYGCAGLTENPHATGPAKLAFQETIEDSSTGLSITFSALISQLRQVPVVYVGEQHSLPRDHEIQLKIIQALVDDGVDVSVGMEMFDFTYQAKLDLWSAGDMAWPDFLKQVHWYANWKFNADLYKDILLFIQNHHIRLIGINIPFCLPPKIAIGGLESLSPSERAQLPAKIDLSQKDHRAYLLSIFNEHHFQGKGDFETFYEAQCAWEDGMAQRIAENAGKGVMVVLTGNGHIIRKFGIPERAFNRSRLDYKTVYLTTDTMDASAQDGDFIWTTAPEDSYQEDPHPRLSRDNK